MREIILCKYGELVLKGANRPVFEEKLIKTLKYRAKRYGNFEIRKSQSTVTIKPKDDSADMDGMFAACGKVFGLAALNRAALCEKDMDAIRKTVREYLPASLEGKKTFKVEGKRSDKSFPLNSMEIAREIGAEILSLFGNENNDRTDRMRVDVKNPEITVRIEIREFGACVHAGQVPGAGGLPVSSSGCGMLLLSGGIDSPVAGFMAAKRGVRLEAMHFESFPYTSEAARQKALDLASVLAEWAGNINVHVVSLTKIQEEILRHCDNEYFTLILRRFMMTIASLYAEKRGCGALITGESLGQVASQTMRAIAVTNAASSLPVLRPCIGLDKREIIDMASKIGTFEISELPFEDCCTVFTPRHPKTRPSLEKALEEEKKLDFEGLTREALEGLTTFKVEPRR